MNNVVYDLALEPQASVLSPFEEGTPIAYMATAFYPIGTDVPVGDLQLRVSIPRLDVAGVDKPRLYLGMTRSSSTVGEMTPVRIRKFEVSQR